MSQTVSIIHSHGESTYFEALADALEWAKTLMLNGATFQFQEVSLRVAQALIEKNPEASRWRKAD